MTFRVLPLPESSVEVRWALRRVRLPRDVVGCMVIPADALTRPDDRTGPPPGVLAWWGSLTAHLLAQPGAAVRVVQDRRRWWGTGVLVSAATVPGVLALVAAQDGVPSSAGMFTLAWGVQAGRGRVWCRGAAFSVADHVGMCVCAPRAELAALRAWVEPGAT